MVWYDGPAKPIQVAKTAETTENQLCAGKDVIHRQVFCQVEGPGCPLLKSLLAYIQQAFEVPVAPCVLEP